MSSPYLFAGVFVFASWLPGMPQSSLSLNFLRSVNFFMNAYLSCDTLFLGSYLISSPPPPLLVGTFSSTSNIVFPLLPSIELGEAIITLGFFFRQFRVTVLSSTNLIESWVGSGISKYVQIYTYFFLISANLFVCATSSGSTSSPSNSKRIT